MFNNLLESSAKKRSNAKGTMVSIVAHSAIIGFLVWATAKAALPPEEPDVQNVTYVDIPRRVDEPPPPAPDVPRDAPPASSDQVYAPPPPKGFQVLTAPVDIPDVIPDVDLSRRATNAEDFSGKGVAGGVAKGVAGGTGPVTNESVPYWDFQVERAVEVDQDRSPKPIYPSTLQQAGIVGAVKVQFVVDTTGRAEPSSIKILESTHELFTQSVKNVLPRMRFFPAEVGGRKVRQLVQQPFNFRLD